MTTFRTGETFVMLKTIQDGVQTREYMQESMRLEESNTISGMIRNSFVQLSLASFGLETSDKSSGKEGRNVS
jgi:hypothetical protein